MDLTKLLNELQRVDKQLMVKKRVYGVTVSGEYWKHLKSLVKPQHVDEVFKNDRIFTGNFGIELVWMPGQQSKMLPYFNGKEWDKIRIEAWKLQAKMT